MNATIFRRLTIVCAILGGATARADFTFRLESISSLPEKPRLHVGLFLAGPGTFSGFTVTVNHAMKDLVFGEADLGASDLGQDAFALVDAVADPEHGSVDIEASLVEPVTLTADESRLLDLVFLLKGGIPPGTVLAMGFGGVHTVLVEGSDVAAEATDGEVVIPDDNFLVMSDAWGHPGQTDVPVELKVFNRDQLQGLQVSCSFDNTALRLADVVPDTTTQELEAEFFEPIINNDEGHLVLGVLLDALEPFDPYKLYPSTGYHLHIATLHFDVKPDAPAGQDVPVAFVDGLGYPPIKNRVVVDHQSVEPQTIDGIFTIGALPVFIRGNANQDYTVNIADPVRILMHLFLESPLACEKAGDANDDGELWIDDATYMLAYLFRLGPVIPPPFPLEGTDPTTDDLSCEHYEARDPLAGGG
jgi:hypothetical protein